MKDEELHDLSRYVVDADVLPSRYEIIVGYDQSLDEYFASVFDLTQAAGDDEGLVLTYKGALRDLGELTSALEAFVSLPMRLMNVLEAERFRLEGEPARKAPFRVITGGRSVSDSTGTRVKRSG